MIDAKNMSKWREIQVRSSNLNEPFGPVLLRHADPHPPLSKKANCLKYAQFSETYAKTIFGNFYVEKSFRLKFIIDFFL